jgi:hypothetical protein
MQLMKICYLIVIFKIKYINKKNIKVYNNNKKFIL